MAEIKICGIYREADGEIIRRARPDYFGMVINFPKSHRSVLPAQAESLRGLIPREIPAVGVFVNQPVELVIDLLNRGVINIAQLHGNESPAEITRIQKATGKPVWKAFKIRSQSDLEEAKASPADLILLDNGYGTGKPFDWNLIGEVGRPFGLAGGLTPENLPQAIRQINPTLVDLSSGVETEKIKDEEKVLRAVAAVRNTERK